MSKHFDLSEDVPDEIHRLLDQEYKADRRVRIYYGDPDTGRAWGDMHQGYIGRSTGEKQIPLVIRAGDPGGPAVMTKNILKVEKVWNGQTIYRRGPIFLPDDREYRVINEQDPGPYDQTTAET